MLTGLLAQGAGPDFADDLRHAGASEGMISLLGRCVARKAERRPKDAREVLGLLAGMGGTKTVEVRFRKSADQGNASAQYNLGVMYENGQGVKRDDARATELYREAAAQGNAKAIEALARRDAK